jgi:hypothetical protein
MIALLFLAPPIFVSLISGTQFSDIALSGWVTVEQR